MTADLIAFLSARLDEDEAAARAATPGPWTHDPLKQWHDGDDFVTLTKPHEFVGYGGPSPFRGCIATTGNPSQKEAVRNAVHIARHDPARVLREVAFARWLIKEANVLETYRAELSEQAPDSIRLEAATAAADHAMLTVRARAAVYADHPDFKETWRNA